MSGDIAKELRHASDFYDFEGGDYAALMDRAADEIERLRAALQRIADDYDKYGTIEPETITDVVRAALRRD